ncbi:MAG: Stp1/IreP family PP2C-type Ser/Thr phosphatase [Syntrophomonas sp.]|nr:Stp1/IreP family PP2C-type Ser/Thr phosphatase [Syntrophomonas sp.]
MIKNKPGFMVGAVSDTGKKRKNNEDNWVIHRADSSTANKTEPSLFIVADGIGGSAAGEVASKIAVEGVVKAYLDLPEMNPSAALRAAILDAHKQINTRAEEFPQFTGMGSTLTTLVLVGDIAYLGQIGDSRAYLVRDNNMVQLTEDQTVTADLVAQGKITPAEAKTHSQRHVLIQAMGGGRNAPEPDLMSYAVKAGDTLILCTDGLYNLVNDDEIRRIAVYNNPQSACEQMVQLANERGGTDNITVMVIKMTGLYWMRRLQRALQQLKNNAQAVSAIPGNYLGHNAYRVNK